MKVSMRKLTTPHRAPAACRCASRPAELIEDDVHMTNSSLNFLGIGAKIRLTELSEGGDERNTTKPSG